MKYTDVIWDFNGTLLNDVDISVEAVNNALGKRGYPETDKQKYLKQIDMPIEKYYAKLFDLEKVPMAVLTREFNEYFDSNSHRLTLSCGALQALRAFDEAGLRQTIISSFKEEKIVLLCRELGIAGYFGKILGADDIKAESKIDRGKNYIANLPQGSKAVVIGDLVHDWEMAKAMGADAILYSGGHQSRETLMKVGVPVVDSLSEAVNMIL